MKTKINIQRKFTAILFFCVLTMLIVSQTQIVFASEITSEKMIDLINQSRIEAGVFSLTVNSRLTFAAQAKAEDMFRLQYFDHNSPSGTTPWHWMKQSGYNYSFAGENLAIDFITAEGAHKALMESPSHQKNILNPNYSEIGIAVRSDIFKKTESIIIVEMFGSPPQVIENKSYENIASAREPESDVKATETKTVEIFPAVAAMILEEENEVDEAEKIEGENIRYDNAMYDPELRICKVYDFEFTKFAFKFSGI